MNAISNDKATELLDLVREARRTVAVDERTRCRFGSTRIQQDEAREESMRAFSVVVAAIYSLTPEGAQ